MGSKREEERNEKIIRGLMKLPPNRRCINCNSLGPQYVCTNFWTFVCMTCSGIHREFTHRVKSVSMAKFTSQEVDSLQKGGNQRARELFLKAWDPQNQRLPDNSNVEKVREFIKNVYVDKRYTVGKSPDRPPRDPQSIRSHEEETRRASSYHSYSQSPPYDFQYEEQRYGKHAPSLTRKPGSDRGLYEGKLASFSSPSRFSDHANDERFANEGPYPRASDYSVSSGGDPFRSDGISPSSRGGIGSPFSETSSYFSSETSGHHSVMRKDVPRTQRTASSGSFGSFDSLSFKSVNSTGLQEAASEPGQSVETSNVKTSSLPSLNQSPVSTTFDGLDLFAEPFAPQNVTSTNTTVYKPQLPESSLAQFVDLFQQSISPVTNLPPSPLDPTGLSEQQSVASSNGGWATFDVPQNLVPVGTENSVPVTVPFSDGNDRGTFNLFSLDQSSSRQNATSHEPSASTPALWHDCPQNVETTTNNTESWNAFGDDHQPVLKDSHQAAQAAVLGASDANRSHGFGVYEALNTDLQVRTPNEIEPPSAGLSSHFGVALHDFSMVPAAGAYSIATERKPTNPFDLPYDADLESSQMTQFWEMSSLQAALPNNQAPAPYVGNANESWFPQNSVSPYAPARVALDPPSGSFGFPAGQISSTQLPSVTGQGPVASIGGNPFA